MESSPCDEKVYTQTICKSRSPSNGQLEVMWTGSKANVRVFNVMWHRYNCKLHRKIEKSLYDVRPSQDDNTWLKANKSADTSLMKAVQWQECYWKLSPVEDGACLRGVVVFYRKPQVCGAAMPVSQMCRDFVQRWIPSWKRRQYEPPLRLFSSRMEKTEQHHDEYMKNNSKLSCGIIMILGCEIKYLDVSAIPVKQ